MPWTYILDTEDKELIQLAFRHYHPKIIWEIVRRRSGYGKYCQIEDEQILAPEFEKWIVMSFPADALCDVNYYEAISRMPLCMIRKIASDVAIANSAKFGGRRVHLCSEHAYILSELAIRNRWDVCKALMDDGTIHYVNLKAFSCSSIKKAGLCGHRRFQRMAERYYAKRTEAMHKLQETLPSRKRHRSP